MMVWLAGTSFVLAAITSGCVRWFALRYQIVDRPDLASHRKRKGQQIPLLGGVAVWFAFVAVTAWWFPQLTAGYLLPKHLIGIWLAGAVLIVAGVLDDKFNLKPQQQILFAILATLVIVASGIGINYITNPVGGIINLQQYQWTMFVYNNFPYQLTLWADLFTVIWLMVSMYTTKLLDGLDGLVSGIGTIGGVVIGLISLSVFVQQPETASLAFIFAGACAGFLVWNFYPAKLYLGEGGALFVGFMLGVLAILSGGKIATALLILGLPLLDVVAVVIRRLSQGKSPFRGDLLHLHFQLQQVGWSQPKIILIYYLITAAFGSATLLFSGLTKVIVMGILLCVGLSLVAYASLHRSRI